MNVLKFTTAGSVDDGKSTLIGRLLYDTRSLTTDQIKAIEDAGKRKGKKELDLSLATDGLIAEREQGITIDVAHIYFSTPKRKFIIADTPGHVEYTRNMITGASSSQAALILIDARNGMLEQTKRHLYLTNLLRIKEVIICINKMDLVNYDEKVFYSISADVKRYSEGLYHNDFNLHFFPVSAKLGCNVVTRSDAMPWYQGQPLLSFLETLPIDENKNLQARFAVQLVIRTDSKEKPDYRAYAGKVKSGRFVCGDKVVVLPSGKTTTIRAIERFNEVLPSASAGESVSFLLNDNIDISRGYLLAKDNEAPLPRKEINATICWMDTEKMNPSARYLLQHGIMRQPVIINNVKSITDPASLNTILKKDVELNDIADVTLRTAEPIYTDTFEQNPANGSFILIDNTTYNTVAVGFIR